MNHGDQGPAYGLWMVAALNAAIFIFFAFSFFRPRTGRDWRSFGAFSSFLVALFAEMYGFPLTIYVLSGWLGRRFPGVNLLSHDFGHVWYTLLGFKGDPHLNPIHILSNLLILGGFLLLSSSWRVLYAAQTAGRLASTGPYARVRHPQYDAFIVIMLGFLLQWPTLLTLAMFPVLLVMYVRLARREEQEVRAHLGPTWEAYAAETPAFVPSLGRRRRHAPPVEHGGWA